MCGVVFTSIVRSFNYFPYQQSLAAVLFITSVSVVAAVTFFGLQHIESQQYPTNISDFSVQQPIRVYDNDHFIIYEAYSQSSNEFIAPSDIPDTLSTTVVALEDPTFYKHPGVTLTFFLDYCKEKLLLIPTDERVSITQQLAQNALGGPAQSFPALMRELILTLQLEKRYSKEQILAMYLSITPFGLEVGANNAATRLFDKALHTISDQEAILLASIITTDPLQEIDSNTTFGHKYQDTISTLQDRQLFSEAFLEKNHPVPPYSPEIRTAHLNAVQLIFSEVKSQLPHDYQIKNGLHIYSSINFKFQNDIQRVVIENSPNSIQISPQTAIVLADTANGSITAVTGYSEDYTALSQLIEATTSLQKHINSPATQAIHGVVTVTTPQGTKVGLTPPAIKVSQHQVQAQEPVFSALANNTTITGWVFDEKTNHISKEASEKIINAIADHLLQSTKESNTK